MRKFTVVMMILIISIFFVSGCASTQVADSRVGWGGYKYKLENLKYNAYGYRHSGLSSNRYHVNLELINHGNKNLRVNVVCNVFSVEHSFNKPECYRVILPPHSKHRIHKLLMSINGLQWRCEIW